MRSAPRSVRFDVWAHAVEGEPPLAGAVHGGGWGSHELRPSLAGIDDGLRLLLAQQWTQVGLSAHAAVARHARFALQLLSFGAPPELLSRTQSAMADKTRHTRVAFALASHYEGRSVGPGKLALDQEPDADELEQVVRALIVSGALAETATSSEAKELLEHVTDPVLRFALGELERDAAEHALLAWRSLIWLCDSFGERATSVVEQAIAGLQAALAQRPSSEPDAADEALLALGYLAPAVRASLRRGALERPVLRGLDAMLTGAAAPSSVDGGRLTLV